MTRLFSNNEFGKVKTLNRKAVGETTALSRQSEISASEQICTPILSGAPISYNPEVRQ